MSETGEASMLSRIWKTIRRIWKELAQIGPW